jgi:hypothetical protein
MARRRRSSFLRSRRALRSGGVVVGLLVLLFTLCWGANRMEQLQRRRTALQRELTFQSDEYNRLLARWLTATCRDRIVTRAQAELGLQEPAADEKAVVVLPASEAHPGDHPFLERLARGLDRYGAIPMASAEEGR